MHGNSVLLLIMLALCHAYYLLIKLTISVLSVFQQALNFLKNNPILVQTELNLSITSKVRNSSH